MPDPIPSFELPPVTEVAMGLQFHPLKGFDVKTILSYWLRIRDRYPLVEDQPPLAHLKDSPIAPVSEDPQIFQLGSKVPVRYWFIDNAKSELIQIQQDRFLRNWRRVRGDEVYPRFGPLFDSFWREWKDFQTFAQKEKLPNIQLDQCELTYVNHIEPDQKWDGFSGLPDIFSVLRKMETKAFLPPPEVLRWQSAYQLPGKGGRLTAEIAPAFRGSDMRLIVSFTLTARGMATDALDESLGAWFEIAHESIVRGFDEITTPTMHEIWKKKS